MTPAAPPADEAARLAALEGFDVLDSLPEQAYNDIAVLASRICAAPIALISFVDADRQWFKSRVGLDAAQTPRDIAFCAHAILEPGQTFVVNDARKDARFLDNPLVTGDPSFRFYAGAPIVDADNHALGTVCVIDREPRELDAGQIGALQALARLTGELLERRRLSRLEAARALDRNRRMMETLVAVNMQGLDLTAFIDTDYVFQYANQTYLDYFAKPLEAVKGKTVREVMGDETFEKAIQPKLARALAGELIFFEQRIDFPGRGSRHMEAAYIPARGEDGHIIGVVVRVHDINEQVERENQLAATVASLEQKTLAQQRFIHILSHDLREPVNSIVNFSGLLHDTYAASLPPAGRDFVKRVHGGGKRLKDLLADLIELVGLDTVEPVFGPVDLNRVIDELRVDLDDALQRSGGTLVTTSLPIVEGEQTLLRVLFQNLVANGLKFTRVGVAPQVAIEALGIDLGWEIRVSDNGIGMPQEQLEYVFEMFKRLHSRKQYDGTGLGLSTCRRIAEMHGGRVWATSEPGHGARLHVWLPARAIENQAESET